MSEYIYFSYSEVLANEDGDISLPREEIVRCHDCKYSTGDGTCCWHFAYDELDGYNEWITQPADVEPTGFCKWGERREQC